MTDSDLAAQIQELSDIEAIKQLKALYCYAIDDGQIEALMDRFRQDAVWAGGPADRYEGKAAIAQYLRDQPERTSTVENHDRSQTIWLP